MSRVNKSTKIGLYLLCAVVVIVCTVLSIKWNSSAFQLRVATPASGEGSLILGSHPDDTLKVSVLKGSATYYTLDTVRAQMVAAVQKANTELQDALDDITVTPSTTTRGILIYLPPNIPKFENEVKAMYLSIAVMRTYQPENVKTDFLIFTTADNFAFAEAIGCSSTPRANRNEDEKCIVLSHVPLSARNVSTEILVDYHNYIDSMLILAEFEHLDQYDFLMRSDSDTFLTPGFGDWNLPPGVVIATGRGGYGSKNANDHLSWVATGPLGLKYAGRENIGSTWYGQTNVMVAASKLTIEVMRWLDSQEFSYFEKHHAGVEGWPNWHWPVILLYGGHIAINQIQNSKIATHEEGVMEFDYSAGNNVEMPLTVKHIHCWHSDTFFSKFKFEMGLYKDTDLTEYQNMDSAAAYAGTLAISSNRLSVSELRDLINNKSAIQNKEWVRVKM